MNVGLFLLRAVIGAIMAGHGAQKLFGWFGGHGVEGTASFFGSLGYREPREMAILAGAAELAAGLALVTGFLTPLAAAGIIGVMVNAILAVHLSNGLWNTNGGYEYNLVLATAAAAIAFTGAGAWSLDAAIAWGLEGAGWGIVAVLLGVVSGAGLLAMRSVSAGTSSEQPASEDAEDREREEQAVAA